MAKNSKPINQHKIWLKIFNALSNYAHSQNQCEEMTTAVFKQLKEDLKK